MDGLRYVCSCCKEFCTAFPSSLFNAEELSYDWEMSSSCCNAMVETFTEDEIELFKDIKPELDAGDLEERDLMVYFALQKEEDDND